MVWFEVGQAVGKETSGVSTKRSLDPGPLLSCSAKLQRRVGKLAQRRAAGDREAGMCCPRGCNSSSSRLMGLVSLLLLS